MTTFSQLVDAMVRETRRPDMRVDIETYLNQTLREVHMHPATNGAITYRENLKEIQLVADVEERFSWEQPNPKVFQTLLAVRYDSICGFDDSRRWISSVEPGIGMMGKTRYFYQIGSRFFFAGYGGIGAKISLAWFEYTPRLKYYVVDSRPATWDDETGWTYLPAYDVDDATREAARNLVSNWLLARWEDVLSEGVRAKVYKRLSDTERSRTTFSMYGSLRGGLFTSEAVNLAGIG